MMMTTKEFAQQIDQLVDKTAQTHETVFIKGDSGNVVMISEEDWNSINSILQVVSMSGIAESIRSGLQEEIDTTADNID
ncbi:type II toxin-antitoxin system Phd/YefM family antitoxin [Oceanospirillum maris]|uniref:type II toxin-antitoxin system Phd/YefM family antitoxin n=1 Tax=Oceanospirillum maris TaxID=64977 RepID=UPI00041EF98E|nr:hypothetical protein [Oceanospirillum maris]